MKDEKFRGVTLSGLPELIRQCRKCQTCRAPVMTKNFRSTDCAKALWKHRDLI